MIKELVLKNRSCRRFFQGQPVKHQALLELVDLARLSASAANLQPLKYILSSSPEKNRKIFPHLAWAGYLKEWHGPAEGEKPAAYIIIIGDTRITKSFGCDHGIAAQSILLGAAEKGLAGCIIGSVEREKLRRQLRIPAQYQILLVIAVGKPREKIVLEDVGADENIQYWRDSDQAHHVPKRTLKQIIID